MPAWRIALGFRPKSDWRPNPVLSSPSQVGSGPPPCGAVPKQDDRNTERPGAISRPAFGAPLSRFNNMTFTERLTGQCAGTNLQTPSTTQSDLLCLDQRRIPRVQTVTSTRDHVS